MVFYPSGKKNILITGGAGFLGSHLCDELVKNNHLICLDNLSGGNVRNIDHLLAQPNFRFIKHDINEPFNLENFPELGRFKIKVQGIQEIYHLACPTSAKNFEKNKIEILKANSIGTLNLLEMAKQYKAKFLFGSSSVVYGPRPVDKKPFEENNFGWVNFIGPRSCFDEGKRFAEAACVTYQQVFGLEIKIARIFRTYGPRMPLFDKQMIADFVLQAINNRPLFIYGDQNFSSSLCYVSDIIEGLVLFMSSPETGPMNFGSPDDYKLLEVAKKIIELTGSKSEIIFKPATVFISELGLPEISLAKEKLGWLPLIKLDKGLEKTINDIKANRLLLQPLVEQYDQE